MAALGRLGIADEGAQEFAAAQRPVGIDAGFAGHIHYDDFRLLLSRRGEAVAAEKIAPGISPIFGQNPGFHVFTYDRPSGRPIDYSTHYLANLTVGLAARDGHWKKEYSFARRYGLPVVASHPVYYLSPEGAGLQRLVTAIRINQPLKTLPETACAPPGSRFLTQKEMADRFEELPVALDAAEEIAAREGLLATFMGRPFADQGGSGFHLHMSLRAGDGHNAFADDGGPDGLSPLAGSFVAGILEHAGGLQALLGPTVNAYKRILPDSLAPTHGNWGHDNRTAMCRVPLERGHRSRVEVRTGDGAACAHLITAALLLAGLDGIERELAPPEPVVGDAYRMDDAHAGTKLPTDLGSALDALEADTWLVGELGEELVSTFVAMKRFEVERFGEAVGTFDPEVITEWEVREYAAHL